MIWSVVHCQYPSLFLTPLSTSMFPNLQIKMWGLDHTANWVSYIPSLKSNWVEFSMLLQSTGAIHYLDCIHLVLHSAIHVPSRSTFLHSFSGIPNQMSNSNQFATHWACSLSSGLLEAVAIRRVLQGGLGPFPCVDQPRIGAKWGWGQHLGNVLGVSSHT